MRVAVFSDVHANLEALEAFFEHAAGRQIDSFMCLGDIVGYCADPNACIELLRSVENIGFILGNHDHAAVSQAYCMGGDARRAIQWTKAKLTDSNLEFLKSMEISRKWGDVLYCHANPYRPLEWYYVEEREYIARSFARCKAKILFIGHTHVAAAITRRNFFCIYIRMPQDHTVVPVAELNRQIFNCGSVGQPRDGDPRASYLVYDSDRNLVEFYRVAYDIDKAAAKILSAGLPESLALRLAEGL